MMHLLVLAEKLFLGSNSIFLEIIKNVILKKKEGYRKVFENHKSCPSVCSVR